MATQGSVLINMGPHPGKTNGEFVVSGQASISATALVDAWLTPKNTADHSIDEHVIDGPIISAGNVVAGEGFTIYAYAPNGRLYGEWSVSWVWNN